MAVLKTRERPKVGVGVLLTSVVHPNCVLIGMRKGRFGRGLYALPGGHLEFGEDWIECAERELKEETGLKMTDAFYATVVNSVVEEWNSHYVAFFVQGEVDFSYQSEPVNMEPEKCAGWEWCDWERFPPPKKLFPPLQAVRKCYNPFA